MKKLHVEFASRGRHDRRMKIIQKATVVTRHHTTHQGDIAFHEMGVLVKLTANGSEMFVPYAAMDHVQLPAGSMEGMIGDESAVKGSGSAPKGGAKG